MFKKGSVLVAVLVIGLLLGGCGGDTSQTSQAGQQAGQETGQQTGQQAEPKQARQAMTEWNDQDMDVETNGNLAVALSHLEGLTADDVIANSGSEQPTLIMKAPWKYLGKTMAFTGQVGIVQDYPPGSDVGRAFGGDVGEIVMVTGDLTYVDYMAIGGTGSVGVGDHVTVYGYPIGLVEVDNQIGGKTTQLMIVGKLDLIN